jgi:hypothetical protein
LKKFDIFLLTTGGIGSINYNQVATTAQRVTMLDLRMPECSGGSPRNSLNRPFFIERNNASDL